MRLLAILEEMRGYALGDGPPPEGHPVQALYDEALDEVEALLTPAPAAEVGQPWRKATSMFTLIPNVVSDKPVGDGVLVGWTNCGACMKHIRHCECADGPVVPKHIAEWADQWFTRTDGFGAQSAPAESVPTPATAVRGVNVTDFVDAGMVAAAKAAKGKARSAKLVERYVVVERGARGAKPFAVVDVKEGNRVEAEYDDAAEAHARADQLNEGITKARAAMGYAEKVVHLTTPDGGGLACGEPLLSEEGATAEINDVTCAGCIEAHEQVVAEQEDA